MSMKRGGDLENCWQIGQFINSTIYGRSYTYWHLLSHSGDDAVIIWHFVFSSSIAYIVEH